MIAALAVAAPARTGDRRPATRALGRRAAATHPGRGGLSRRPATARRRPGIRRAGRGVVHPGADGPRARVGDPDRADALPQDLPRAPDRGGAGGERGGVGHPERGQVRALQLPLPHALSSPAGSTTSSPGGSTRHGRTTSGRTTGASGSSSPRTAALSSSTPWARSPPAGSRWPVTSSGGAPSRRSAGCATPPSGAPPGPDLSGPPAHPPTPLPHHRDGLRPLAGGGGPDDRILG